MTHICTLLGRNLRVFLRHRSAVVFTLLAPLVIVLLYATCFHGQLINMVSGLLPSSSEATTGAITAAWIMTTTVVLCGFTSGASFVAIVNEDREAGHFELYRTASVGRIQAALAYILAIFIVILTMSAIVMVIGEGWLALLDQPLLTSGQCLHALGGILLSSLLFTGLSGLAAGTVRSRTGLAAYMVLGAVAVGFLSFSWAMPQIYTLPSLVGVLPFALATALVRRPVLARLLEDYAAEFSPSPGYTNDLIYSLGGSIQIADGALWPVAVTVLIILVWIVVLLIGATVRMASSMGGTRTR